ncbi:MAG: AAA family ATPase [Gaiellales bacterium]
MFELPGQPRAAVLLDAALREPAHAYLLHGPAGTGKRDAARAFAAALLGCDVRRIVPGSHPDLAMIEPEGEVLLVDQVHELAGALRYRPQEGARRVGIVDEADRLNRDAANAFLKTLEEPPGDVVLILIADDLHRVLPTVRSRCQPVAFPPLAASAIAERLIAAGTPADAAQAIGRRARGDLAFAQRLAADPSVGAWVDGIERDVAALLTEGLAEDAAVQRTYAGVKAVGEAAEAEAKAATAAQLERLDRLPSSRELDRERKRIETAGTASANRRRRRAETDMMRAVIATVQLVLRDAVCAQADAADRAGSGLPADVLVRIGAEIPRARLEHAIDGVDDVRRALAQPINVPLALAAVYARIGMARHREAVTA